MRMCSGSPTPQAAAHVANAEDGQTSRDFCSVANAAQATLLAGTVVDAAAAANQICSVAMANKTAQGGELHSLAGHRTTLEAKHQRIGTTAPPMYATARRCRRR